MKARRLPGVRCSTENTECKSLLCLMIMPGRSWVAGIDMRVNVSSKSCDLLGPAKRATCPPDTGIKHLSLHGDGAYFQTRVPWPSGIHPRAAGPGNTIE